MSVAYAPVYPGAPIVEQWPGNPQIGDYSVKPLGTNVWLVQEVHGPQTNLTTNSFAQEGYWASTLGQNQFLVGWHPPYFAQSFAAAAPVASVPEASTWLMLTLGLALLLCGRKLAAIRVR